MKKLVLASAMALASVCLCYRVHLRAQDSGQPIESRFQSSSTLIKASTQTSPTAKATALEAFLTAYPQSVVKKAVLDLLIDTYQQTSDPDKALSAATRLLQVEPNNMKAHLHLGLRRRPCARRTSIRLPATPRIRRPATIPRRWPRRGLTAPKPAGALRRRLEEYDRRNAYPIFHSAIALDDVVSKKDYKGAITGVQHRS